MKGQPVYKFMMYSEFQSELFERQCELVQSEVATMMKHRDGASQFTFISKREGIVQYYNACQTDFLIDAAITCVIQMNTTDRLLFLERLIAIK